MELRDKVIAITGAASGIGAAMAARFATEEPAALVLADLTWPDNGAGIALDVADRAAVERFISGIEEEHGRIDLYCSNAGVASGSGVHAPDETWQRLWDVNVMGTVHAARALLPGVQRRGQGYLLVTASAAGLLTNLGDAPYTATKHAAVGLAEWLSITHRDDGLTVSCLCPQGVRTPMLTGGLAAGDEAARVVEMMGVIEPADVAEAVVAGLREERFLILPHPEVAEYQRNKATDPDRWLGGMRKLRRRLAGG